MPPYLDTTGPGDPGVVQSPWARCCVSSDMGGVRFAFFCDEGGGKCASLSSATKAVGSALRFLLRRRRWEVRFAFFFDEGGAESASLSSRRRRWEVRFAFFCDEGGGKCALLSSRRRRWEVRFAFFPTKAVGSALRFLPDEGGGKCASLSSRRRRWEVRFAFFFDEGGGKCASLSSSTMCPRSNRRGMWGPSGSLLQHMIPALRLCPQRPSHGMSRSPRARWRARRFHTEARATCPS